VTRDAVLKPIIATRIHRIILKVAADVAVKGAKLVRTGMLVMAFMSQDGDYK
jgi:hypothetical protein